MDDFAVLMMLCMFSFTGVTLYGIQTITKNRLMVMHSKCISDSYVATVQSLSQHVGQVLVKNMVDKEINRDKKKSQKL